ncbi:MAG: hypothetical protein M3O50_12530, partial [Myxococcota bacterium]|nr:hypothetical protein [Myxococcota bacterium]
MKLLPLVAWPLLLVGTVWACSSANPPAVPTLASSGSASSGASASGSSSGGSYAASGAAMGGSSSGGASSGGSSGTAGSGALSDVDSGSTPSMSGASGASSGSVIPVEAGADATPSSDEGGPFEAATVGGGEASTAVSQWYEAEAVPPNLLTGGVNITTCAGSAQYGRGASCPVDALKEGALCCSAGKVAVNLLGRLPARLEFHNVTVPNDGSYDVTWWYHCGAN